MRKSVRSGGIERGAYRYEWGVANRLLAKENELTGTVMRYDYDRFDFLIRQETIQGSETDVIYRVPDFVGNLFETPDKKDRKYGAGGKLLEDPDCFYHYDDEGNLIFREFKQLQETGVRYDRKRMEKERGIRCLATGTGWLYEWASNGMLKKVIRPDGRPVEFRYDALGRRTAKQYFGKITRWVWDRNVPIHEWSYKVIDIQSDEEESTPLKEPTEDITTWVFEAGTFVPTAKIQDGKQYSIVSDYLGTPIQMYDEQGNKTWDCTLDIYGKVLAIDKGTEFDCPFRYQGQYEDEETGLYYNRFRYYDSNAGSYISQDPIGLESDTLNFYDYVCDLYNPYGNKKGGGFKKKPGRKPNKKTSLHGNCRTSTKPAVLYAQYDSEGNFMKYGITQEIDNPMARYRNTIPSDWEVVEMTRGNRSDMLDLERELSEKVGGPLNQESWAGTKRGDPLSPKAEAVHTKMQSHH